MFSKGHTINPQIKYIFSKIFKYKQLFTDDFDTIYHKHPHNSPALLHIPDPLLFLPQPPVFGHGFVFVSPAHQEYPTSDGLPIPW